SFRGEMDRNRAASAGRSKNGSVRGEGNWFRLVCMTLVAGRPSGAHNPEGAGSNLPPPPLAQKGLATIRESLFSSRRYPVLYPVPRAKGARLTPGVPSGESQEARSDLVRPVVRG